MYKAIRLVYTEKEHVENHLYSHRKEKIKNQNANIISLRSRAPGLVTHFWSLNSLMPRLDRGGERRQLGGGASRRAKPTAKLPVEDPHLQSHTGPPYSSAKRGALQGVDPLSWKTFEKDPCSPRLPVGGEFGAASFLELPLLHMTAPSALWCRQGLGFVWGV